MGIFDVFGDQSAGELGIQGASQLPPPIGPIVAIASALDKVFGIFGSPSTPSPEQLALAADNRTQFLLEQAADPFTLAETRATEDISRRPGEAQNPHIIISDPILARSIADAFEFGSEDPVESGLAQKAFEEDIAEIQKNRQDAIDELSEKTAQGVLEKNPLIILDAFLLDKVLFPDPPVFPDVPEPPPPDPPPEEEKRVSIFDIFGTVFDSGGIGDVPFSPDLVDVFQAAGDIIGLFADEETSAVPVPQTVGGSEMAICAPGQRTLTPLQVLQACAKRTTGRSISKKGVKAMARNCGLHQTAATLGCTLEVVCMVVSSPTRRRTGISSADMRKTRSTIGKVTRMYDSLPKRSAARRRSTAK